METPISSSFIIIFAVLYLRRAVFPSGCSVLISCGCAENVQRNVQARPVIVKNPDGSITQHYSMPPQYQAGPQQTLLENTGCWLICHEMEKWGAWTTPDFFGLSQNRNTMEYLWAKEYNGMGKCWLFRGLHSGMGQERVLGHSRAHFCVKQSSHLVHFLHFLWHPKRLTYKNVDGSNFGKQETPRPCGGPGLLAKLLGPSRPWRRQCRPQSILQRPLWPLWPLWRNLLRCR